MDKYWHWREYKRCQGSLVWQSNYSKIILAKFWMKWFPKYQVSVTFKIEE